MTKLWRRAAAILMAGLLTVGMAACSGGGNNSSTAMAVLPALPRAAILPRAILLTWVTISPLAAPIPAK